jgi:hypothetical protein
MLSKGHQDVAYPNHHSGKTTTYPRDPQNWRCGIVGGGVSSILAVLFRMVRVFENETDGQIGMSWVFERHSGGRSSKSGGRLTVETDFIASLLRVLC